MTKTSKSNEKAEPIAKDSPSPQSEQMMMHQTIVTSRKIVIDEKTGQVRFADEEPEKEPEGEQSPISGQLQDSPTDAPAAESPQDEAPPEVAKLDVDQTMAEVSLEQVAALRQAKVDAEKAAAEPAPLGGNKRLSSETLFAFALPEAVLKEEMEKIKKSAATRGPVTSASDSKAEGSGSKTPIKIGIIAALVLVGAFVLYHVFGPGTPEAVNPKIAVDRPADTQSGDPAVTKLDKDKSSQPSTTEQAQQVVAAAVELPTVDLPTVDLPTVDLPTGPIDKTTVKELSIEQLVLLTKSGAPEVLTVVIEEAVSRKDQTLLGEVVGLAKHPSFVVRVTVVKAFGELGIYEEQISEKVETMLLEKVVDDDELVRGFAAKALGATGEKAYLETLRGRLDSENSEVVLKIIRVAIATLEQS